MANIIFFGTPDFAERCLEHVHAFAEQSNHKLIGVVCQPDKPSERGQQMHAPAVKVLAEKLGFPVWQPPKITLEFIEWFETQKIDLAIVVAYGKILPERLLKASRLGFVNVHGSLLPRWRGAAPIQRAIEAGDAETGVCIMNLVPEMDAGEVYMTAKTPIEANETSGELFERLSKLGAETLIKALPGILNGTLPKIPQPDSGITHARKVTKEEASIDWTQSAEQIHNKCRAMQPWPGSYTNYQGKKLRLFKSSPLSTEWKGVGSEVSERAGQILELGDTLVVATGNGALAFQEAQLEGRRRMDIQSLLNGFQMQVGELLC